MKQERDNYSSQESHSSRGRRQNKLHNGQSYMYHAGLDQYSPPLSSNSRVMQFGAQTDYTASTRFNNANATLYNKTLTTGILESTQNTNFLKTGRSFSKKKLM